MITEYKYTVQDVAGMISVGEETVRRWCRDNKIKCLKLPGKKGEFRFSTEDIKAFVADLNTPRGG